MPIYEFYSPDTGKIYSFFARTLSHAHKIPNCPDGKKFKMHKKFSSFAVTGKVKKNDEGKQLLDKGDDNFDPLENLPPGQASKVMRELEGAVSSMDDENPDPRQMGALMRRVCDLTGEKIDGTMEEVVRKLEEGTDPEELESKLGESLENLDDAQEENSDEKVPHRRRFHFSMVRDPNLYEMEDYLK